MIDPAAARRRLLLLTATRWFPVGLTVGLTTLLALDRGLTVPQTTTVLAAQGLTILLLELPTGGLADAIGRRPVLLAAGVVGIASGVLMLLADGFWGFAAAWALQGVFRALDSGPLEAWYVDTVRADDPGRPIEGTLSLAGTVLGVAIAAGALVSGGLVAWHPLPGIGALALPLGVAVAVNVVHLGLVGLLVREPARRGSGLRAAWGQASRTPRAVRDGVALLGTDRILLGVVAVELFWAVGMVAFETLLPIRLAELLGGQTAAGTVLGPSTAVAWGLFALGSGLVGPLSRRVGVARAAVVARVLNGAFVVLMGLATGPVGLLAAYLITYATHGAANPVHATLLHRRAGPANRVTVLSVNSLVGHACASAGLLVLGPLAAATSTPTAMVAAGAFSVLGAAGYLPALREERRAAARPGLARSAPAAESHRGAGD